MKSNRIHPLQGPDRVRKRPAVIFQAEDITGAQNAVGMLLEIFAAQAQLGHCKHLTVKQAHTQLEISADDRGLYLGQDTGDDSIWRSLFCEMFAGPLYAPEDSGYSFGLTDDCRHALFGDKQKADSIFLPQDSNLGELYAIQCVCKYMDVTTNRGGIHSALRFSQGHNLGGVCHVPTSDPNGTCFRFELDDGVFQQTLIPPAFFRKRLQELAMLSPGLCCTYINHGVQETFCYEGGIAQYVTREGSMLPAFQNQLCAKGRERYNRPEYEACVQIALSYAPNAGQVKCLHNFRDLTCGGTHLTVLKSRLCRAFDQFFLVDGEEPFTFAELSPHLRIVLASFCTQRCTLWENGTRLSIQNQLITHMTQDAAGALCDYVHTHREILQEMANAIIRSRRK